MSNRDDMWDVVEELRKRELIDGYILLKPCERDALVKWIRYLEAEVHKQAA